MYNTVRGVPVIAFKNAMDKTRGGRGENAIALYTPILNTLGCLKHALDIVMQMISNIIRGNFCNQSIKNKYFKSVAQQGQN